jgi:L-2-hydroxyglutarate oxidase LhgO
MSEFVQTVVIGAGVVGLAIARSLAMSGREVIVLESEDAIGTGTSARNSEVIHAGIYYPKDSNKARLCVEGKHLLYDYCTSHGINHRRIGKLLVATNIEELPALEEMKLKAEANGVDDLTDMSADEIRATEPNVKAVGALFSPSTGIVDSHGLMLALQGDAEAAGAMIAFSAPVTGGHIESDGITLNIGGDTPMTLKCAEMINAAGHGAVQIAAKLDGLPSEFIPPQPTQFAKGNYFILSGKSPFNHLIYPVPVPGGLGTHSTLDLGGQTKFGPDVEWVNELNYEVDPSRAGLFYASIRRFWPGLPDGALMPGYVGIRPKLRGVEAGKYADDFLIEGPDAHGIPGLVNLFGIESPGLTSCLAIANDTLRHLGT